MRLFIEPTEPLLFRTGRPFTAGENNFAESLFPPTPETIQGAVRAAIGAQWEKLERRKTGSAKDFAELFRPESRLVSIIGNRDTFGCFRITGLTLGRRTEAGKVERLFPAPATLIEARFQGEQHKTLLRLRPVEESQGIISNLPSGMKLLLPVKEQEQQTNIKTEPLNGWLNAQGLKKALNANPTIEFKDDEFVSSGKIYEREPRLGIGIQSITKTSQEGFLYQVQMIRMKPDYGFVVDIRLSETPENGSGETPLPENFLDDVQAQEKLGLESSAQGWLTLGGEQRAAHFEVLKPEEMADENGLEEQKTGKLLYLATPAYFQDGWRPADATFQPASLVSAAISRYQPIGGWYLAAGSAGGESKRMRRCVPAGSVYFFDRAVTIRQPLTEYGWQIGYGITYAGAW